MSVQQLFDEVSRRLLHEDRDVERTRMFRSEGLKTRTNGKFFASVSGSGLLLVKLPAARVTELVTAGAGEPFHSGGRLMKEWVLLRPADEVECSAYVEEAHRFVAAAGRR